MLKKRYFSTHHNFKTGILCKLTLFLGFLFLIIYLIFLVISLVLNNENTGFLKQLFDISQSTIPLSLVSLAALLIFFGVLLYFFSCQFAKLEKIADEIENSEEINDEKFK